MVIFDIDYSKATQADRLVGGTVAPTAPTAPKAPVLTPPPVVPPAVPPAVPPIVVITFPPFPAFPAFPVFVIR
jgi:hypothetical protein